MIQLRGIRVMGTHGVLPEEQARPQPFEVDLDVEAGLALDVAADSDDLNDTVDYGAVAEAVLRIVGTERHQLIERLAARIADATLAEDDRITAVTVTVRKLRPPVPVLMDSAGVRLTRRRP